METVQSHLKTKEAGRRDRQIVPNADHSKLVRSLPSYIEALLRESRVTRSMAPRRPAITPADHATPHDQSLPIYPCTSCDEAWIQGGDGMLECRSYQSFCAKLPLGLGPPTQWWVHYTPERGSQALATACAVTTKLTPPSTPTRGKSAEELISLSQESTGSAVSASGELSVGCSFAVCVMNRTQGRLPRQALHSLRSTFTGTRCPRGHLLPIPSAGVTGHWMARKCKHGHM